MVRPVPLSDLSEPRWQFWIDRGGTFTDVVAVDPAGRLQVAKLLSSDPGRYDDAAVEAMRRLTGRREGPLPPADIRIGTTIATNALLERKGERVLLAITRGFGDALIIGTQERSDIFARQIVRPPPLHAQVLEIHERVMADGQIDRVLDHSETLAALRTARAGGITSIAIVLMHGYRYPAHEQAVAALAREAGFARITVSHATVPLAKLIGRADTTLVDAYLSPLLDDYVAQLSAAVGAANAPLFMQSNGGLTAAATFSGKDAILSGPAGGIVGMAKTSARAGFDRVIGFDMGGTSTDVSLFAGAYDRDNETSVAGVRIRTPMLRIHTIAAGGGSICRFAGGRMVVGPESAGAVPGPACYRRGGPLTITDCNLILGKLDPALFPAVFGSGGDERIDLEAADARMAEVLDGVRRAGGRAMTPREAAEGFVAVAVAGMANAIKAVSVARGHDCANFSLACFGGAGGQHACLVADALGVRTVVVHPLTGVLSAYGMGLADRRDVRERTVGLPLDADNALLIDAAAETLTVEARSALVAQGLDGDAVVVTASALVRTERGDTTIEVLMGDAAAMAAHFAARHRERFGYDTQASLVVDTLRIDAIVATVPPKVSLPEPTRAASAPFTAGTHVREGLAAGQVIDGPALIVDAAATIVVEPGWRAVADDHATLILSRHTAPVAGAADATIDPARLEIYAGLFMAIAEEMGVALQQSAASVNIRERLDFSCALFDNDGNLIANAPHIPVHLGSMGDSIRTVIARHGKTIRHGHVYALNAPYQGGTHLPDITVIKPVFVPGASAPSWFVAARGHHADVGGISPGSMPSDSRTIHDEGIVLDAVVLVEDGRLREVEMRALLGAGPHPARNIDQNLADLAAQVAACNRGAQALLALAADQGEGVVTAYMAHLLDTSELAVRALIGTLSDGRFAVETDTGAKVQVALSVDREAAQLTIDFSGTSAQRDDNFNAPLPVVRAACLYVMRALLGSGVPMNDGCLRPVTLIVPSGSMLDPHYPAAVVAGNVETSQVVTDALFGALGAMAASQGTMNNFTFGDDAHQYYETIAGGSGAGPGFAGTAVVQTHMTNSRMTDPEMLEQRYPVLVEEFSIRRGSGGAGRWAGGDGGTRRIRFLKPMRANILSNRRRVPPFGLDGGEPGGLGLNRIERADGRCETLPATAQADLEPDDVFVIETPGGGGYGRAD